MAIQSHINRENNNNNNLGLLPLSSSQDYFFMSNNNINNNINSNNNNNLLYNKLLQQQQFQYAQQQHQQQQFQYAQLLQLQQQQQQQNNSNVNHGSLMFTQPSSKRQKLHEVTTTATTTSSLTSEGDNHMSTLLEKQRNEIDRFVNLQNERLKMALQEQRKQQFREIVKKLEERTLELLKQKDDEIKALSKKTMELQEMLKKIEFENQTWQKLALENQSMVFSLNNSLEQLKQQQACSSSSSNNVDDNASSCNFIESNKKSTLIRQNEENLVNFGAETGENVVVLGDNGPGKQQHYPSASTAPVNGGAGDKLCKICKSRNATILLLPCRHLCCCKVCDGIVDDCPVCKSSKMASIEALIS